MRDRYSSRKFILAMHAMVISSIALLNEIIDGNAWFLSIGVILGLYGAANVMAQKQHESE